MAAISTPIRRWARGKCAASGWHAPLTGEGAVSGCAEEPAGSQLTFGDARSDEESDDLQDYDDDEEGDDFEHASLTREGAASGCAKAPVGRQVPLGGARSDEESDDLWEYDESGARVSKRPPIRRSAAQRKGLDDRNASGHGRIPPAMPSINRHAPRGSAAAAPAGKKVLGPRGTCRLTVGRPVGEGISAAVRREHQGAAARHAAARHNRRSTELGTTSMASSPLPRRCSRRTLRRGRAPPPRERAPRSRTRPPRPRACAPPRPRARAPRSRARPPYSKCRHPRPRACAPRQRD